MNGVNFVKFYNSIKVDDYIDKDVKNIFHYTSPLGFSAMIENNTLRFTDRFYLNDKSEGIYVLKLCIENIDTFAFLTYDFKKAFLEECNKRINQPQTSRFFVYQCSFSMDEDSLCLWNYYTKSDGIKGYNLKFDANNLSKNILISPYNDDMVPELRYGKVIYEKEKQLEILFDIVEKFFNYAKKDTDLDEAFFSSYLVDKIMYLGVFFKMPCFSIENEYRLAYDLYLKADNKYAVIKDKQKFYEKNGIFIPYLDLHFDEKTLIGVGVYPTLDYESTQKSILRIMGAKYSNINKNTIHESKIPVRY